MATPGTELSNLSPLERRKRNRQQMISSILAAARSVMQESGAASLNLNEVARRVQLRPQSLAGYFPNKAALYDALVSMAVELASAGDEEAYRDHPPGWEQVEAWFTNRFEIALANPDLFHLAFDRPVPDYTPEADVVARTRSILEGARAMVSNGIDAGVLHPDIPVEQATDVLLAIRRGLVAERLGKHHYADSTRFQNQIPNVISILKSAWSPARGDVSTEQLDPSIEGGAMPD